LRGNSLNPCSMTSMANPMDALHSYQKRVSEFATEERRVQGDYFMHQGQKGDGFTVDLLKVVSGDVQALAIFAVEDPMNGVPRFGVGYAVAEKFQRCGIGFETITTGIKEIARQVHQQGVQKFYVEALIDKTNIPSINLAKKIFPGNGTAMLDEDSGTPALLFYKLIESKP
jgi:hypothetical protein